MVSVGTPIVVFTSIGESLNEQTCERLRTTRTSEKQPPYGHTQRPAYHHMSSLVCNRAEPFPAAKAIPTSSQLLLPHIRSPHKAELYNPALKERQKVRVFFETTSALETIAPVCSFLAEVVLRGPHERLVCVDDSAQPGLQRDILWTLGLVEVISTKVV